MARTDVPFYRQTLDFSCGSACILMVLGHFDPGFVLNRNAEIDIWREGTSVLALGMGRYGLSFPLVSRGYRVEVTTNSGDIDFMPRIKERLNPNQFEQFRNLYFERRERVLGMGLVESRREDISIDTVRTTIEGGGIPIVLTNAKELGDDDAPHWVVFTGVEDGTFTINNPLDSAGGSSFGSAEFNRISGFRGEKTIVSVFDRANGR